MKEKVLLIFFLCNVALFVSAQSHMEKGLQSISRSSTEAIINFLAGDELQGREAGFHGSRVASEYIVSLLQWIGVQPLNESYFQPFEAYRKERQKKGRLEVHPDSIAKLKQEVHQKLSMRNVLGMIPGKNTKEYVIVGAHFDHLGIDPALDGDQIYNGADDNASGVSAVLQIARAFVASGKQSERNVIFAFWDGEEKGLLGSKYFVQTCPFISRIKGYLNFDMIGRNNKPQQPEHVVYFYTAAHPVFGDWLKEDIKKYGLRLSPDYRAWDNPVGGSDNGSFAKAGIPIIWYHTDGHPDYHQPSDHADRLNWENNLFAKGACIAVKDRLEDRKLKGYRYLSDSLVVADVGMDMRVMGSPAYYPLTEGGSNWYECSAGCELILDDTKELVFTVSLPDETEKKRVAMALDGLPERPNRTTRLALTLKYVSPKECEVTVRDLGFGEMYPSSGKVWKELVRWDETEERKQV